MINDRYGHLAGDKVLRAVADQLTSVIRPFDFAGRFGGEEFVTICPEVKIRELLDIGERVRASIENLSIDVEQPDFETLRLTVTASVGAAVYPDAGTELDDLLLSADIALFSAKDLGRNRVEYRWQNQTTIPGQDSSDDPASS